MRIIAYTYEADWHCPFCAKERFGAGLDQGALDNEGNEVHPVFETDEVPIEGASCSDCGCEVIEHGLRLAYLVPMLCPYCKRYFCVETPAAGTYPCPYCRGMTSANCDLAGDEFDMDVSAVSGGECSECGDLVFGAFPDKDGVVRCRSCSCTGQ